jgi:uncharacterized alkaline shock family protein YloU
MSENIGSIIVSPGVLATIAKLTALSVPGVARMNLGLGYDVARILRREVEGDGVHVEVDEDVVSIDLHIVALPGYNILRLGRQIQSEVARATEEMVGMPVGDINVHIDDVDEQVPDNSE